MSGSRGYNTYRGRKPVGKIILAVLLVLVILGAVGFMVLQKYLVYDDSGKPRLDLPKGNSSAQSSSPAEGSSSSGDLQITVQQPEKTETVLRGIQLGEDPSAWKAETDGLAAAGENAFCVTMKASGGRLQYQSTVKGASLADTAAAASAALPGLLAGDGTYSIARISCLRDSLYAKSHIENAGLKNTGGYIFYDGSNDNWLDPSKQGARDYLCAVAKECAAMGFDEIVLTDLSYPTEGKLKKISYGTPVGAQSQADYNADQIAGCLSAVRDALKDTGVKLSIEVPAAVVTANGVDETAGIDLWNKLAASVDHIYVPTTADQIAALSQLMTKQDAFVPELTAAPAGVSAGQPYLLVS